VIEMANETSSFPAMGDGWIAHVCNMSGARSPYSTDVSKKNTASGGATGEKANRSATTAKMGSETNGPTGKIVANIVHENDPNAALTHRNFKKMNSSNSFMGARKAAGNDKYGA
jgi:hypothetical protein